MTRKQKLEAWREFRSALRDYRWKRRSAMLAATQGNIQHAYSAEASARSAIEVAETADRLFGGRG